MGYRTVCIGDVGDYRKSFVKPVEGTIYSYYSLSAFDIGMTPEKLDGSEIMSSKLRIEDGDILMNKLNMRFRRIWPVRDLCANSVCSTEFVPLHPRRGVDSRFIRYVPLSDSFTQD